MILLGNRGTCVGSGAGTNLKVGGRGGTGPAQKWGHRNIFCWSCPSTFLALKVQLVVLVSAFVMVSTVWSVSFLLFFYSRCPPCPDICKSGGRAPLCPMESAPLCVGTACPWALLYSTDGESRTRDLSTTSQGTIRNCYSIE